MTPFILDATRSTPEIRFHPATHHLEIVGESYPEHAAKFYGPVFEWLDSYLAEPSEAPLLVTFNLLYFNSSTSKILLNFLDRLDEAAAKRPVRIEWRFNRENDVAEECGEEFREEVKRAVFVMIPLP